MALDKKQGYQDAASKINAYKSTISTQATEKALKKLSLGDNFELPKSEAVKQLNDIKDNKQRLQSEIKNQFEELIDLFKASIPDLPTNNSQTIDFLLKQVLSASQNTKSRITEVVIEESMKVAGCSQEQTFEGNEVGQNSSNSPNKLYIRVNQIDLFKLLNKDPEEKNNSILYEKNPPVNGQLPFSMDRELYNRLQDEGNSFNDAFGSDYIGDSGSQIMDIRYVTSYVDNGTTYYGDFYEISLRNRPNLNRVSDFLRDYYKSIDLLNFDGLMVKILNSLNNFVDISANVSTSEKETSAKFEKRIQRILGLCFDNTKEIDVSGNAKTSSLDTIDESFFELTSVDLREIENQINNMVMGVTEYEDCGNIKFPVNVQSTIDDIIDIRELPENQKIDAFIQSVENSVKGDSDPTGVDGGSIKLPDGINVDIAIKGGILKLIPRAVIMTIISPKVLLGLMIVLKSLGSTIINAIEDFETFMQNMKQYLINIVSKIGSIFVEELFKLLKANLRKLVEVLSIEIVKESKNAKVKMIVSIIYILIQLSSAVIDWRQCKSVVDEILNLLNLGIAALPSRPPTFALAAAGLLPGFSPTRAMANISENFQKLGLPTGDMPDGSPNLMLPSILQQIKGGNDEKLANSVAHTWCAPVPAFGVTGPIACTGKEV
jgi:hypothetical protein